MSGVSAGAINAALFTLYPPGEEKALSDELLETWMSLTNDQIKQSWSKFGIMTSAFNQKGLYDDTPLREWSESKLDGQDCKREVYVGTVDVNSGEYCTFGSYEYWDNFADLIVASGSAPMYFPPM